ncbi:MAG: diguanylate cyclase [Gammaproteobacteria bacterium]|nr:diguanylate cyclase [Gammaproteobacteria bacterium]
MLQFTDQSTTPSWSNSDSVSADLPRATREELVQLRLLEGVELSGVEGLLRRCAVRTLVVGEVLVRAGETCPALYFVLSGRLRARDPSSILPDTFIEVGDGFGELSLFQWAPSTVTVMALEAARVLVVDAQTAGTLVATSHPLARNLLNVLAERLRASAGTVGNTGQLAAAYKRHATLDEATGLHNRRWLENVLPRQIMRSSMAGKSLALLLVDIDDFGQYNADFGYDAGDHALYAVAQTLLNSVRPTDLAARYGAGQFAIVLPEADIAGAGVVAERVRHAVGEAVVLMSDESILPPVSVSIGIAELAPFSDAPTLLAAAQQALREASKS